MTIVKILLAPRDVIRDVLFTKSQAGLISDNLHLYTEAGEFETALIGEEAAEEAFDLTNNPSRDDERQEKYGNGRSVSSGDVIDVDGKKFACLSFGWATL